MSDRRRFMGAGIAVAAASLSPSSHTAERASARQAGRSTARLFVYQPSDPAAIEAGRVMAGQGIRVLGLDASDRVSLEAALSGLWARGPAPVVGLTDEAGFRQALDLAATFGLSRSHRAPADSGALVHWIVGLG